LKMVWPVLLLLLPYGTLSQEEFVTDCKNFRAADNCTCNQWVDIKGVDSKMQYYMTCEKYAYSKYAKVCEERQGQGLYSFHGREDDLMTIVDQIIGPGGEKIGWLKYHVMFELNYTYIHEFDDYGELLWADGKSAHKGGFVNIDFYYSWFDGSCPILVGKNGVYRVEEKKLS